MMVNQRRHHQQHSQQEQQHHHQDRLSLDDTISLTSSCSNSSQNRQSSSSSSSRRHQQCHHHHHHNHSFHLSKTSLLLFIALLVGGLVIPVAISFSSILSDKDVFSTNTAIILILQNSKKISHKQQQQQQQSSTSKHHRIVFLESSSSSKVPHETTVRINVAVVEVEPMTTSDACPYCQVEADQHRWPFEEHFYKECEPMKEWQKMSFPTCNLLHQLDMIPQLVPVMTAVNSTNNNATMTTTTSVLSPSLLSTAGSWRTVWTVQDTAVVTTTSTTTVVVVAKFLNFFRNFTHESYEKHNTDALIMEHLTASPYILNAHAYCGQSVITEHADTDIRSFIKRSDFGSRSRLRLARDMAGALAVLHYRDDIIASSSSTATISNSTSREGQQQHQQRPLRATIAHNDLNIANVLVVKDKVKLNDFNIAILLRQQKRRKHHVNNSSSSSEEWFEACGAPVRFANDMWKAPEDVANLTYVDPAASDVYSLGNLLFHVLTRRMPWGALEPEFANLHINNSSNNINNMTANMLNATTKRPPRLSSKVVRQRKLLQGPNNTTLEASSSTPYIPLRFVQSNKTAERALVLAIQACYRYDPTTRPTSRELALSLSRAMEIVEMTKNRHDLLLLLGNNNNNDNDDHLHDIFAKDYWTSRQEQY